MSRWIALGVAAVGLVLIAVQWPEIERYRRIRAM
jgi:hypothetical protein